MGTDYRGMATEGPRVGIVQMTSTNCADRNFNICANLARRAREQGCEMIFFPECFAFIGAFPGEAQKIAEPLDGRWMERYRKLARHEQLWLSLGGFHEYGDGTKIYNTHVVLDNCGEIRAHYRKIHLFDVPMVNLVESKQSMPGSQLVVVDSPVGRLGLTICYDLRFPELYQKLRFVYGADVMLVPSAFAVKTGEAHWETLLRCRAIETQCYVIAAAQAGQHNSDGSKRRSYGHAMAVDPWGSVLCDLGTEAPEGGSLSIFAIDPELMRRTRENMPMHEHRRYDLYGDSVHIAEKGPVASSEADGSIVVSDASKAFFG